MARLVRLVLPGLPHHVVLRGINQLPVFKDDQDYEWFLQMLAEQLKAQPISLHAYTLLPSRIHLLLTPQTAVTLSSIMQGIGRRYVRYFNQRHQRFGTLWEGRFRAGPLQPAPYALAVMTFIDWQAVQAGSAAQPHEYPWSSYQHFAGHTITRMLSAHPQYWDLADTPAGREAAYQALVAAGLGGTLADQIEKSAMGGWLLGSANFVREMADLTPRRLGPGKPGRPRKSAPDGVSPSGGSPA